MPNAEEITLQKKMMGVKVRHARNKAGLSLKEVGAAIGGSEEIVSAIELGHYEPSLPELEVMAFLFNVPVIYFWSADPLEKTDWDFPTLDAISLRQRIIGVLLQQARVEAGRSHEQVAELLNIPAGQVVSYELGRSPIPVSELETLASYLNVSIEYFVDEGISHKGPNGHKVSLDEIAQFGELPDDVRAFLLNPANLLYVNIAMRLSGMSADTLRGLAEGLLEVTY